MANRKKEKAGVDTRVDHWPEGLVGQMNFILESPDVDPTMRWALLREIEIICAETTKKKEIKEQVDRVAGKIDHLRQKIKAEAREVKTAIEGIRRQRSVYFRNSKPVARKEGACLVFDVFHRITE